MKKRHGVVDDVATLAKRWVRKKGRLGLRPRRADRIKEHGVDRVRMRQVEWCGDEEPDDEGQTEVLG